MSDRFQTVRLANGLRVAAAPLSATSFVEIVIGVRVGSRYEHRASSGISHFTEHLLFRGSKGFPSSFSLNHALESLGDGLQAGTTREYSLYAIGVPAANLERTLDVLANLLKDPLFDEIDTERKIVSEEMLEDLDEDGNQTDLDAISREHLFGDHGLGLPVIGTRESLNSLSAEDIRQFFQEFYQPDNMVIIGAGNLDPEKFFGTVSRLFGKAEEVFPSEPVYLEDWEPASAERRFAENDPPPPVLGPVYEYRPFASSQTEVLLSFLAAGERSEGWLAQVFLERILDDGLASRLQRSLCERRGLVYDIQATNDLYSDVGAFDLHFRIRAENTRVALREVFRELRRLQSEPVPAEELERVKGRMQREAQALFESPRALAGRLAETLLLGLVVPVTLSEWHRQIRAMDAATLMEAARRLFVPEHLVAVIAGDVPREDRGEIEQILSFKAI
jgi:predicted Zn-dependent peptidase